MPQRRRITVVNDNPDFLELMAELLDDEGYDVSVIDGDTISGIEPIRQTNPDLVFVDLRLRPTDLSGWDIATAVKADPQLGNVPLVLCTADAYQARERAEAMAALPKVEILLKPFSIDDMEALLGRLLV